MAGDGWRSSFRIARRRRPNERSKWRNKIDRKVLDFVIVDAEFRPVACVELDDRSHERRDRRERDVFVDQALGTAGLPLVRVAAKRAYSVQEVARLLGG